MAPSRGGRDDSRSIRVLAFGLDGATWRVIRPLLEQGRLPHMARLIASGASGVLKSLPPPHLTPMVWTTIASGKLPDKHGVRDFTATSRSVRVKRLWDILAERGRSIGLWGHPLTWPPKPVWGFMIPDFLALGPETFPPEYEFIRKLSQEEKLGARRGVGGYLRDAGLGVRYGVRLGSLAGAAGFLARKTLGRISSLDEFYLKRLVGLRMQRDLFIGLYRRYRPDYGFFYTNLVDACSHNYWRYYDPSAFAEVSPDLVKRYGRVIPEMYCRADEALGSLLREVSEETVIVVCSDHGFTAVRQEGRMFLIRITPFLSRLGLEGRVRGFHAGLHVYFASEDPALLETLRDEIAEIRLDGEAEPLFRVWIDEFGNVVAKAKSEVGRGEDLSGRALRFRRGACPFEEVIDASGLRMSGMHHEDGILILRGPRVRRGVTLEGARVEDVTPTLLRLLGLPRAQDMDGRVLEEALEAELTGGGWPEIETYEERGTGPETEDVRLTAEVEERLRALGYLD